MGTFIECTYCIELCCLPVLWGEISSEQLVRAVVVSKSPRLGKRCCGQSGMQDGAGMRTGRSCFRWIVVGWHSVAIWRSVCCWMSTMVGVRRVLSVSARGIRSQGRLMGCSFSQQNCVCECTEVRWVNDVKVRESKKSSTAFADAQALLS